MKMEDGLTMKYTVKGGEIFFSRNEENVTKAAVIRAFHHARQLQRDSGPEELESSVGCYLYSVYTISSFLLSLHQQELSTIRNSKLRKATLCEAQYIGWFQSERKIQGMR